MAPRVISVEVGRIAIWPKCCRDPFTIGMLDQLCARVANSAYSVPESSDLAPAARWGFFVGAAPSCQRGIAGDVAALLGSQFERAACSHALSPCWSALVSPMAARLTCRTC